MDKEKTNNKLDTNEQAQHSNGDNLNVEPSSGMTRNNLVDSICAYLSRKDDSSKRQMQSSIWRWLSLKTNAYSYITKSRNVIYLMLDRPLIDSDADRIYRAIKNKKDDNKLPILLILQSNGGQIEPAYFIGKILRDGTDMEVSVPRSAKSAATLICCAASKIHMGGLSQLGPIDPQINGVPALGLKNAIQHIAELAGKYPSAIELFIGYMSNRVEPLDLGYYERVVESSMQYAMRLLTSAHKGVQPKLIEQIARILTYEYKDHGFVIDRQEAANIFPPDVVATDTAEYLVADIIYKEIQFIRFVARDCGYSFSFVGNDVDAFDFRPLPKRGR